MRELTCHTISGINDDTSQCPLVDLGRSPRSSKSQYSLNSNIPILVSSGEDHAVRRAHNPWTLKLSNMISAVFSLFSGGFRGGSVYLCQLCFLVCWRKTYKEDIMVLWFGTQVLENTLFPEPLHMIPILNHTMFDRIVQAIGSDISFIPMQGIY